MAKVIGVNVGGTRTRAAVVDGEHVVRQACADTPATGVLELIGFIGELVRTTAEYDDIERIGVGMAGVLENGYMTISPNIPCLTKQPVLGLLQSEFPNMPVTVMNDADAEGLCEARFGIGKGFSSFAFVSVGTGIGGSFFIDGQLFHDGEGAAEFGHMTMKFDSDVLCACGEYGHLEAFASGTAIARRARQYGKWESAEAVAKAAQQDDPVAASILAEAGNILGCGLAAIANVLRPSCIVLGGSVALGSDLLRTTAEGALRKHALPHARSTPVLLSQFGENAGVVGATLA